MLIKLLNLRFLLTFPIVSITEPEVRVTNFELMEVRADVARFSWESSNCRRHHGEYRGYAYVLRIGEDVQQTGTVNGTELTVEDLTAYTDYSIQVWFINHYGKGPKMEPMSFLTMEDRKLDTNIMVKNMSQLIIKRNKTSIV